MAVELLKVVKKLGKSVELAEKKANVSLEKPSESLKDAVDGLEQAAKDVEEKIEECEKQANDNAKAKKRNNPDSGSKRVQARPARPWRTKDLARIAKHIIDEYPCASIQIEVLAAVSSQVGGVLDWVQVLINICQHIRDIYRILYDYSDFSQQIDALSGLSDSLIGLPFVPDFLIEFFQYVLGVWVWLLGLPRRLVLKLKVIDDLMIVFIKFLELFRTEINKFLR